VPRVARKSESKPKKLRDEDGVASESRHTSRWEFVMSVRPMSPDEQVVYKNMVDNLSFMKRQQWTITSYATAIFLGLLGLTQGRHLDASAIRLMTWMIALGLIGCWYLLIRVQYDKRKVRNDLDEVHKVHFDCQQRKRFRGEYKFPFLRDVDFLIVFMIVSGGAAWLVIYFLHHPVA
jgi:hypothetical protein